MLKGIPRLISPELLKLLDEMGHGDELVLADGNFPAAGIARRLVRLDAAGTAEVLDAVLTLLPLDHLSTPVCYMETDPEERQEIAIWNEYAQILRQRHGTADCVELLARAEFYARAARAYAVVATGELAVYANIILKKGIV